MIHIELNRIHGDFGFEATDAMGHKVTTDTSPDEGGENFGVRPMQMLLMGLGACSGIDVVSILKKQRQIITGFKLKIDGEREQGVTPSVWKEIKMFFEFTGDIDLEKAKRACDLSVEKYCSVAETLRRAGATITWEVRVN